MPDATMSRILVDKSFITLDADSDKRAVIHSLTSALAQARKIKSADIDSVVEGAMNRESIGSTGIGHGIAIPHCRTDAVKIFAVPMAIALMVLILIALMLESSVYSVFLLLTPTAMKQEHLELMKASLAKFAKTDFVIFYGKLRMEKSSAHCLKNLKRKHMGDQEQQQNQRKHSKKQHRLASRCQTARKQRLKRDHQ